MGDDKHHMLLWLDTETTAIDPADGQLLEIGMRITELDGSDGSDGGDFSFERVLPHRSIDYTSKTREAIAMHSRNGLLDESFNQPEDFCRSVDWDIQGWLTDCITGLQVHGPAVMLHVAGSNPGFDLGWLDAHCPGVRDSHVWRGHVSHRNLDLSAIRLTLMTVGVNPYAAHRERTHRVHDCLDHDIHQWMQWVEWVREHMNADEPDVDCDFGPSLAARFGREGDRA